MLLFCTVMLEGGEPTDTSVPTKQPAKALLLTMRGCIAAVEPEMMTPRLPPLQEVRDWTRRQTASLLVPSLRTPRVGPASHGPLLQTLCLRPKQRPTAAAPPLT